MADKRVPVFVLFGESLDESKDLPSTCIEILRGSSARDRWVLVTDEVLAVPEHGTVTVRRVKGLNTQLSEGSCFCCGLNSGLGNTLSELFLTSLSKKSVGLSGVVLVLQQANIPAIKLSLRHAPFLAQRFRLAGAWRARGQCELISVCEPKVNTMTQKLSVSIKELLESLLRNTLH